VGLGLAGSLAMLAGGVVLERRDRYVIYARGLIGGGWAALYFTTFAAHAIEAARVISDPFTAAVLLAAVATGMILHSLRYRSEAVTALAYFLGFIALAITPLTAFTVAALIPLAASLLYVAHRFSWNSMAAAGLLATYGVYLAGRGQPGRRPVRPVRLLAAVRGIRLAGRCQTEGRARHRSRPFPAQHLGLCRDLLDAVGSEIGAQPLPVLCPRGGGIPGRHPGARGGAAALHLF
jgi:hypothetical protein